MNARDRIAAQDRVLAAIVKAADEAPSDAIRAEIRSVGAALAKRWNVLHPKLEDTRRSAGQ